MSLYSLSPALRNCPIKNSTVSLFVIELTWRVRRAFFRFYFLSLYVCLNIFLFGFPARQRATAFEKFSKSVS